MTQPPPLDSLLDSWLEGQRQLWNSWLGAAGQAGRGNGEEAPGQGPLDPVSWLQRGLSLGGGEVLGRTAENLLGSQGMVLRSLALLSKAWQAALPRVQAGEDWQQGLRQFLDDWVAQVTAVPQQGAAASKEAAQMLNSVLWDWAPVLGPWLTSAYKASLTGNLGDMLLKNTAGLERLLAMEQEFEPAIGGLAEVPRAGLLRERNAKLLRAMDAMVVLRNSTARYQLLVAKGLAEAVEATLRHLLDRAGDGQPAPGVRDLARTWFRVADQTLMHTFSSPEFVAVQNEVAAASMDYKIQQRAVLEMIYEVLEIPTRAELDDVYRSLHDLKAEVRDLRRQLRAARAQTATGKAAPRKSGARRRPRP